MEAYISNISFIAIYDNVYDTSMTCRVLTPSLPYMTEISVVICHVTQPYMTEISVGFTIVIPGSLDPGMHSGLEVKKLMKNYF